MDHTLKKKLRVIDLIDEDEIYLNKIFFTTALKIFQTAMNHINICIRYKGFW
jgi:hypothetical protein